jgi:ribosomal protein S18 acetylase RimI-like enzyme
MTAMSGVRRPALAQQDAEHPAAYPRCVQVLCLAMIRKICRSNLSCGSQFEVLETRTFNSPSEGVISEIHEIQARIFEHPFALEKIRERVSGKEAFLSIHTYSDRGIVGFKTGFSIGSGVFYSWIGGVDPEHRRLGLGKRMMLLQHQELKALGFVKVQTKTQNRFRDMIILNLKSGFEIVDTFVEDGKGFQIVLEKRL